MCHVGEKMCRGALTPQPPEAAWPQIPKSWRRSRERSKDSALAKAGQILWKMRSRLVPPVLACGSEPHGFTR